MSGTRGRTAIAVVGCTTCRLTPRISRPPDRRQICVCKFDDWLVGRLHAVVRRQHAHHSTPSRATTLEPPPNPRGANTQESKNKAWDQSKREERSQVLTASLGL